MKKLGTLVIASSFAVALGCGSNNSTDGGIIASGGHSATGGSNSSGGAHTSATGGSSGGTSTTATGGSNGGTTAAGGGGGGNGTTSCPLPSCLKDLATDCVESGNCSTLGDLETGSSNTCYDNGVKEIIVNNPTTGDKTVTVKKGSTTCLSTAFNEPNVLAGNGAITLKNGSGTTVATLTIDPASSIYSVTCTGGKEVVLDDSCADVWPIPPLMGSPCDEGACSP
jgi:hypothetical protein